MVFIFQLVNMVYHIDLHILKNPCISGINPTLSWCMSSSSVILGVVLFLCVVIAWFGIRVMVASQNEFGSVPSSAIF